MLEVSQLDTFNDCIFVAPLNSEKISTTFETSHEVRSRLVKLEQPPKTLCILVVFDVSNCSIPSISVTLLR